MSQPARRVSTNLLHIHSLSKDYIHLCTHTQTHTHKVAHKHKNSRHTHICTRTSSPYLSQLMSYFRCWHLGVFLLFLSPCHSIHTVLSLTSSISSSFWLRFLRSCPFSPRCHDQFSTSFFPSPVPGPFPSYLTLSAPFLSLVPLDLSFLRASFFASCWK